MSFTASLSDRRSGRIGTYPVTALALENIVPFDVAAPISTLDLSLASGDQFSIEQRSPKEVTEVSGVPVAPDGIAVDNPRLRRLHRLGTSPRSSPNGGWRGPVRGVVGGAGVERPLTERHQSFRRARGD